MGTLQPLHSKKEVGLFLGVGLFLETEREGGPTERMHFTHVLVILNKWQGFLISPTHELGLRFFVAVGVCFQRKLSKKYPRIPVIR